MQHLKDSSCENNWNYAIRTLLLFGIKSRMESFYSAEIFHLADRYLFVHKVHLLETLSESVTYVLLVTVKLTKRFFLDRDKM